MSQATTKNVGNLDMLILKTALLRYPLFKSGFQHSRRCKGMEQPAYLGL